VGITVSFELFLLGIILLKLLERFQSV